jgi:hypothetical protein
MKIDVFHYHKFVFISVPQMLADHSTYFLLFCWLTPVEIIELKINLRLPNNVHVYCVYIDFELTSDDVFVLVGSVVDIDGPCDDDGPCDGPNLNTVFLFLLADACRNY